MNERRPPRSSGDPTKPVARVGRAPMTTGRDRDLPTPRHRGVLAARSATITVMINAAMKAGRGLRRDFGEVEQLQVSRKGPADFVTVADRQAERVLHQELMRVRPKFGFLGEEGGNTIGDGIHRWIVDPLDGTTNFLHGIPHFAISIALEREGEIIAGLVYAPVNDEIYWAEKGQGAFLDTTHIKSRRLRVSGRKGVDDALIATGIPFRGRGDHGAYLTQLQSVMGATAGVRRYGAAALDLAYVAAGRFDAFWETGLSPWDVAAGWLLVQEAGGLVSQIGGRAYNVDSPTILASNGQITASIDRLLTGASGPGGKKS